MKSTKLTLVIAFLATTFSLVGCAGEGITSPNPYAGTRNGQLGTLDRTALGVMETTVSANGTITGTTINGGGVGEVPGDLPVTGKIEKDGTIAISFGKYTLTGTMKLASKVRGGGGVLFASGELCNQGDPAQVLLYEWWDTP